ncbi:MAG: hypothetical protein R3D30_08315 [Hyphomicrobiales bacterium]
MTEGDIGDPAFDPGADRERRVHQHHTRTNIIIEMIVDLRSIMATNHDVRKQALQQAGAIRRQLVQGEASTLQLGEDCEQPGASRGLEHQVGRHDPGRDTGDEAKRQGGRELLPDLALFRAPGVRRQQGRDPAEHGETGGRRAGARLHRLAEFPNEQDLGRLAGVIGLLPRPDAVGIAAAERCSHGGAQAVAIDRPATLQVGQQQLGGFEQCRGSVGFSRTTPGGGLGIDNGFDSQIGCSGGHEVHGWDPGERDGPSRRVLSLSPVRLDLLPACLFL